PATSDRLNVLAKLQWTDDRNPIGGGVLVPQGKEQRLIGAAELIWAPSPSLEFASRYAMRRTQADRVYADGTPQTLTAWADYIGGRMTLDMTPWLSVRSDGRLLVERTTGSTAWDGSPALVARTAFLSALAIVLSRCAITTTVVPALRRSWMTCWT